MNRIRTLIKFAIDVILWTLCVPIAFLLRVDDLEPFMPSMIVLTIISLFLHTIIVYFMGFHRQSWVRVGFRDPLLLLQGLALGTLIQLAISFLLRPDILIPRSIPLITGVIALFFMAGARVAFRWVFEFRQRQERRPTTDLRRVLIVGAGDVGTLLAQEMSRHPEAGMLPIGYLDDDKMKLNQRMLGFKVLGRIDDLPNVVVDVRADEVLIAIHSDAADQVVRRVVKLAQQANITYRIMPAMTDILTGSMSINQIREVDVTDLLKREPVKLDLDGISGYLKDHVVMVTGAGGSIGSEIVRQVARFSPRRVILIGRGENSLYTLERELDRSLPDLTYITFVLDVRNREKLDRVFNDYRPNVVFHAAAHKHVPLMEGNPDEAVMNNVGGTKNLVELALKYDISRFVNISTDKAVNPTSIMGAAKRVTEYLVLWASQQAKEGSAYVSVRFGNVLGSRGSVIPLFKEQIKLGGPVTITHPDMTRYFKTIPEAAQLVLHAGGMNENSRVYVLDMGESVRIVDLARDLIRLSGLEPDTDIELKFTGVRPGEKLFEELLTAEEGVDVSRHEKIFVARKVGLPDNGQFESLLDRLFESAKAHDDTAIRDTLHTLIPTYDDSTRTS